MENSNGKRNCDTKGKSPDAGKTINRRYTNIWMKRRQMAFGGTSGKCYLQTIIFVQFMNYFFVKNFMISASLQIILSTILFI